MPDARLKAKDHEVSADKVEAALTLLRKVAARPGLLSCHLRQ